MLWLKIITQQAITWASVGPDLCHHIASLSHSELNFIANMLDNFLV